MEPLKCKYESVSAIQHCWCFIHWLFPPQHNCICAYRFILNSICIIKCSSLLILVGDSGLAFKVYKGNGKKTCSSFDTVVLWNTLRQHSGSQYRLEIDLKELFSLQKYEFFVFICILKKGL